MRGRSFTFVEAMAQHEQLMIAQLRILGGALSPGRGAGAVSGLDAQYLMASGGIALDPASAASVTIALDEVYETLAPWRSESMYLNFAETSVPAQRLPYLLLIKRRVDPCDVVRSNHPLVPPLEPIKHRTALITPAAWLSNESGKGTDHVDIIVDPKDVAAVRNLDNVLKLYEGMVNDKNAVEVMPQLVAKGYVQYNPVLPNDVEGLAGGFAYVNATRPLSRVEVHRVVAVGEWGVRARPLRQPPY